MQGESPKNHSVPHVVHARTRGDAIQDPPGYQIFSDLMTSTSKVAFSSVTLKRGRIPVMIVLSLLF